MSGWIKSVLVVLVVVIAAGVLGVAIAPRCFDSDGAPIIRMGNGYCFDPPWRTLKTR